MEQYSFRQTNHMPLRTPSTARGMTPTSPQERPGSSGYAEPRSHHLHQALMERRGFITPQPQQAFPPPTQTTPHRTTPSRRPSTGRATPFKDEWTTAADQGVQRSQSTGPRMRGRRLSESATAGRNGDTPKAGLTIKESNVLIDRLQKENFDLKLRMTLQDEKVKKMSKELDATHERIAMADQLAERCASAEEKAAQLEDQLEQVRARFEETWSHNQELVALSEELTRELDDREGSIDEAAHIIHEMEQRIYQLEEAQTPSANSFGPRLATTHPDSDYFSGEAESPVVAATKAKARPGSSSSSSVMPADSDYYSATSYSSPASAAPKKPRPASRRFKSSPSDTTLVAQHRRANSDQTNETAASFDLDTVQPYDGRRSSTVKPPSTLQPAASIHSSPDPPAPRPGLRRTRRGQLAAVASLRLQGEQQQQQQQQYMSDPTTPRASLYQQATTAPGSAPAPLSTAHAAAIVQRRMLHSATPVQHNLRASSEPPQQQQTWTAPVRQEAAPPQQHQHQAQQARPLRSLYMTGELSRPLTSDTHNRYGDVPQLRVPGQAPAEATPTVLSPAATPAIDDDENDDEEGTTSVATTPAVAAMAAAASRPIIWRDRSNMSTLALAATNAKLQHHGAGGGWVVDDDQMSDGSGSGSPTATIPETITSQVDGEDEAARRARRLGELGSEYSLVSSVAASGTYGGLFGRDVLFRP